MAGARRSARQSAAAPKTYAEDSSSAPDDEGQGPKRNGRQAARRKRVRDAADDDLNEHPPPAKRATKAKPRVMSKAPAASASAKPSKAPVAPPPTASSPTNRDADGKQEVYWLFKAEPLPRYENGVNVAFSIDDLAACDKPEPWTGVRNPQARNNMQAMRTGDLGFFYHSNAKPSGVVGILRVVEEAKVDETAFDNKDPYYDPKSDRANPKWFCVGVEFVKKFGRVVDLREIKSHAAKGGPLENMQLVTLGRLSVCRVRKEEWDFILELAEGKEEKKDDSGPKTTIDAETET